MANPESSAARLSAQELYRVLDYLRDYIQSEFCLINIEKGEVDASGKSVHLDGEAFLSGFHTYLYKQFLEADELISELSYLMEISIYIRNGGIKAIMYRLETSCASLNLDYFDVLAERLVSTAIKQEAKIKSGSALRSRLLEIPFEDEVIVAAAITEIDQILLELSKELEQKAVQSLADYGSIEAAQQQAHEEKEATEE